MNTSSVDKLWREYVNTVNDTEAIKKGYTSWYFCDNRECANELLELVLAGIKRATASALWTYENNGEPVPKEGDLSVITNWDGDAKCIIHTTRIEIIPFNRVSEEFAAIEGEGDKTLRYWRDVHWQYFQNELAQYGKHATDDMPVICEQFNLVYKSRV